MLSGMNNYLVTVFSDFYGKRLQLNKLRSRSDYWTYRFFHYLSFLKIDLSIKILNSAFRSCTTATGQEQGCSWDIKAKLKMSLIQSSCNNLLANEVEKWQSTASPFFIKHCRLRTKHSLSLLSCWAQSKNLHFFFCVNLPALWSNLFPLHWVVICS